MFLSAQQIGIAYQLLQFKHNNVVIGLFSPFDEINIENFKYDKFNKQYHKWNSFDIWFGCDLRSDWHDPINELNHDRCPMTLKLISDKSLFEFEFKVRR